MVFPFHVQLDPAVWLVRVTVALIGAKVAVAAPVPIISVSLSVSHSSRPSTVGAAVVLCTRVRDVPEMAPPVIDTLLAACVAMVPMVAVLTAVTRPLALTVTIGTAVADPN